VTAEEWSEEWVSWVLGCFLLGKQQRSALWLGTVQGYGNWSFSSAALSAPVGQPLAPHTATASGVLQRDFTRALVLLNPTGGYPSSTTDPGRPLRVTLPDSPAHYTDVFGKALVGLDGRVITLQKQTARVLLKVEAGA
jgi:hypothetical protein